MDWTLEDLAAKVREIAARDPRAGYVLPQEETRCQYWHRSTSEPGCLFGVAFQELGGVDLPGLENDAVRKLLEEWFGNLYDYEHYLAFQKVQNIQDWLGMARQPWSVAVRELDELYPLPA